MSATSLRSEEKTEGKIFIWLEVKGMKKTAQAARIKHILERGSSCKRIWSKARGAEDTSGEFSMLKFHGALAKLS